MTSFQGPRFYRSLGEGVAGVYRTGMLRNKMNRDPHVCRRFSDFFFPNLEVLGFLNGCTSRGGDGAASVGASPAPASARVRLVEQYSLARVPPKFLLGIKGKDLFPEP